MEKRKKDILKQNNETSNQSEIKIRDSQLKIYSTMSKRKEVFKTLEDGKVKMYACGITVDDEAHVGHARQAIVFDIIRRYLEFLEFKVVYVRNFTDIDDKIIRKGNMRGKTASEISEKYIKESTDDLRKLKVLPATHEPKVTEHIPEIIDFIQILLDKGFAYENESGVFFNVRKFENYGKLSRRKIEDLIPAEAQDEKKQNPEDFAPWKPAKENEPSFDSPWGKGRPGWHIECSALAKKYLGKSIDIHGGGLDLVFPHHENEIAQSEAANDQVFSTHWLHNGLVMIEGQKMSKSLGNSLTIKDLLRDFPTDTVRFAILSQNYMSPIDFSTELFRNVNKRLFSFYKSLYDIDNIIKNTKEGSKTNYLQELITKMQIDFTKSMNDNFNTAKVLGNLSITFQKVRAFLLSKDIKIEDKITSLKAFREALSQITNVLKVLDENPEDFLADIKKRFLEKNNISLNELNKDIKSRKAAKANKDYSSADEIRKKWQEKNIILKDLPSGDIEWDIIL